MVAVVENYRGVEILRDEPVARGAVEVGADLEQAAVRFHAMPNEIKVVAQSIGAARDEIDRVLDGRQVAAVEEFTAVVVDAGQDRLPFPAQANRSPGGRSCIVIILP